MAIQGVYFRFLAAILFGLQLVSVSLALKGDSGCRNSLCVTATVGDDVVTYELSSGLDTLGWVAVGFGEHMVNSPMVVMWENADGTTTLSQRFTTGYSMPHPDSNPPRVAQVVKPMFAVPGKAYPASWKTLAFQVPANKTFWADPAAREHLVFAYSPNKPEKDPNSIISVHQYAGYHTFDLNKDFTPASIPGHIAQPGKGTSDIANGQPPHKTVYQGSNTALKRYEKLIVLHGFFVSLGFLVILPAGSLIGRYGRAFTPKWFHAHMVSNFYVAFPVITLGVLLGPALVYSKESFRTHFINGHEIYGAVIFAFYCLQVLLGRYIHERRVQLAKLGPITRNHPPLNIVHIGLGVSIITAAFFQVRSGLEWWEALTGRGPITSWAVPLWRVWIVVIPLAYIAGYALLPRQLRQERAAAYAPISDSTHEEPAQTDRLLAEED
jgi:hypothetical protein